MKTKDIAALEKILEQNPKSTLFARLADEYLKGGKVEKAVKVCQEGLKYHPYYVTGHVVMGKCYLAVSSFKEARREFKRALRFDPGNLVAFQYLAEINQALGQTALALSNLRRALRVDPSNGQLREEVERLSQELQLSQAVTGSSETKESSAPLKGRNLTELAAEDQLATVTLAEIYATQGFPNKAVAIYQQILNRNPEDQEVKNRLAELEAQISTEEGSDGE